MKTVVFKEITSTNDYAKTRIPYGKDLFVVAEKQSGGHGTKGRSFSSQTGGVYLTKLTFYKDFPSSETFLIMSDTAVAVCKTLEKYGIEPKIKWANDIFVGKKKICGILIENTFSGDKISCSVVGVGLNVSNALPDELKEIATTIKEVSGKEISVKKVRKELIKNMKKRYSVDEYLSRIGFMGSNAKLIETESETLVTLERVTEKGELVVLENGTERIVRAGEVSLRITEQAND